MPPPFTVEPIVVRMKTVDGALGLHDEADAFDYACSKARADAIDRLLIDVVEGRGWSLSDEDVLERVSVEHAGRTRARIIVDGRAVTPWWDDRVTTSGDQ